MLIYRNSTLGGPGRGYRTWIGLPLIGELKWASKPLYNNRMDCERGPIAIVYDATTYKGTPVLVCFIAGKNADQWLDKPIADLKAAVLVCLFLLFECLQLEKSLQNGLYYRTRVSIGLALFWSYPMRRQRTFDLTTPFTDIAWLQTLILFNISGSTWKLLWESSKKCDPVLCQGLAWWTIHRRWSS